MEELIGKRADVFWADPAKHAVLVEELSRSGHVRDCGNVKLESDFPSQGPVVHADRIQIKQMLTNLVSNASEAVGEHEGRISVAVSVVDREEVLCSRLFPTDWEPNAGRYACLEVSDTGSGLDVATLEKIFDPFFSTKFTGRGLGLPVVLGIVRSGRSSQCGEPIRAWRYLPGVFAPVGTDHFACREDKGACFPARRS